MKLKYYFILLFPLFLSFNSFAVPDSLSDELQELLKAGKRLYAEKQYIKATASFSELIEQCKETNNSYHVGLVHFKLGTFYDNNKNSSKALEHLFTGIEYLSEQPSKQNSSTTSFFIKQDIDSSKAWGIPFPSIEERNKSAALLCDLYNRIGGVYYNEVSYRKAQRYWRKCLQFSIANQVPKAISNALNNLAEAAQMQGNFTEAIPLYQEALVVKKIILDTIGVATVLSNIGNTYLKTRQLDSAKHYFDQSLIFVKNLDDELLKLGILDHYSSYYQSANKINLAIEWYRKTLDMAKKVNDNNMLLSIYENLAILYEDKKQLDSALFFHKKWVELNKKIHYQKKEKLALEIEAEYLITEKEQELAFLKEKTNIENQNVVLRDRIQSFFIVILVVILASVLAILRIRNKNNTKLELNISQINQQNKEKDILLKEIHHRVKNNLQVITSLLSLQSYNITDDKTKELFSHSQYRINSMAMIHEMLYQNNDLSKINYAAYLEQLVSRLVSSIKGPENNIQIDMDVPNIYLNIDTAIPLGLLINEIVTNALKYGLPDDRNGVLSIKITALETPNFKLEIGDNGVGFSKDINHRNTSSLGLKLIHQLTRQLNGTITKDNAKKGTNYLLHFQEIEQSI